jgi:hypothetical protein
MRDEDDFSGIRLEKAALSSKSANPQQERKKP